VTAVRAWVFIWITIFLDGLAGLAGGVLSESWLARHLASLVGFAAGAMLAAVFVDVLPDALTANGLGTAALAWTFGAFVAMAIVEWLVGHHHRGHDGAAERSALPASLLLSDSLHNFGDGAAIAAAFLVSPHAGLGVAVAVIAHEVPQELGDYAILRAAGWRRGRALAALAGVQLTAALGALAVALAEGTFHHLGPVIVSIAAGTFLYIGATDLLPELHAGRTIRDRAERMLGFVAGVFVVVLLAKLT
jgi:zinc and cadmium transporter